MTLKTFGRAQYQWHPNGNGGTADPDGAMLASTVNASPGTTFTLSAASVNVIHGSVKATESPVKAHP